MTTHELQAIQSDLDLLVTAIDAGEYDAALSIVRAMRDDAAGKLREKEGPKYSTFKQNCKLSGLTGRTHYPPRYWQELELSIPEASEAITDLLVEGETTIQGKYYRRTETSKKGRAA